jgi:hypothetical protein
VLYDLKPNAEVWPGRKTKRHWQDPFFSVVMELAPRSEFEALESSDMSPLSVGWASGLECAFVEVGRNLRLG